MGLVLSEAILNITEPKCTSGSVPVKPIELIAVSWFVTFMRVVFQGIQILLASRCHKAKQIQDNWEKPLEVCLLPYEGVVTHCSLGRFVVYSTKKNQMQQKRFSAAQ
jgi:hypothetical protein